MRGKITQGIDITHVRVSLSVMGILLGVSIMGITQCDGYLSVYGVSSWVCPGLGFRVSVCVRSSVYPSVYILLATFV